jgi:hypothetical protein
MRFYGWLQGSSHELTETTKREEKHASPSTQSNRLHHHTSIKKSRSDVAGSAVPVMRVGNLGIM